MGTWLFNVISALVRPRNRRLCLISFQIGERISIKRGKWILRRPVPKLMSFEASVEMASHMHRLGKLSSWAG
jgi:hypothetical protein